MSTRKQIIGQVVEATFVDAGVSGLPARVDTGAYRSSVWATNIAEKDGVLTFTLLGPKSPYYSGKVTTTTEYKLVDVENSFGHKQKRYSVFLRVRINGRLVKSNFTLANRSMKTYPALIGRRLLRKRFVVDVSLGPINDEETNEDEGSE